MNSIGLHNCDKEPIHLINQIQPHGFLLILSSDWKIINSSDNLPDILADSQGLYQQLEKLFVEENFKKWVKKQKLDLPFSFTIDAIPFAATGFFDSEYLILEIEPVNVNAESMQNIAVLSSEFKQQLVESKDVKGASQILASFIQEILDYDRVMIYQFDEEWNGHVISEVVKPGISSYFNHHFPSSDIPEQARELLSKLKTRQIANVEAQPTALKQTTERFNMELSHLRNPSQIHLQFLRNMKVKATLTFAIMNEDKLWGLVCAQHKSAVFKDVFQRILCQNLTDVFAISLYSLRELQNEDVLNTFKHKIHIFIESLIEEQNLRVAVEQHNEALRGIVHASGLAVMVEDEVLTFGSTPSREQIFNIIQQIPVELSIYHTRKLKNLLLEAEAYADIASGLLFVDFTDSLKILWFKPEVNLTKTWAGNPEKPYVSGEGGLKINPRNSFESYQKQVKFTSEPWTATELASANYFFESFEKTYLQLLYTQLSVSKEKLETKNKKLVELSAMMAHDIKSPLTSFKILADLYGSSSQEKDQQDFLQKLKTISQRLLSTSNDLSNLSDILSSDIAKSKENSFSDLYQIVSTKLEGLIIETSAKLVTSFDIETICYPPAYLESILLNLISNAIKYRDLERNLLIKIVTFEENGYICLSVADNGKGMDLAGNAKELFGLYKTFHKHPEARGIGLYITKSQVESMGGQIKVDSIPGKGTTFNVCLKKKETEA